MPTPRVRRSRGRGAGEAQPGTVPRAAAAASLESFLQVLNRDQRTALTIDRPARGETRSDFGSFRRGEAPPRGSPGVPPSSNLYGFLRQIRTRSGSSRKRFLDAARLARRLGEVFVVGVCLLTIVRVPAAMSAPSARHAKTTEQMFSHKPTEDTLSYLHPCGKSHEEEMNNTYYNKMASKESDPDILKHIIIRTKNALAYAESFRDRYVEKTFHVRFEKHHAQWASQRYDWLPNEANGIPKRLGKTVNPLHLKSKTFDEFLVNIYEYLQKFAVGLEQIVADQKRTEGEFTENFRLTEVHLRNVLCEIREAMMERNIAPREQVPRSIMKEDIRHLEQASFRNVRDWFIFRDLMNGLEYVIQVFTFIEENLPSSSGAASS